ncbi:ATP-binding protein [Streptosporangium sp. NPDC051022]|uniref:ATP-binding protein n=1 Tax=Streptosporangium sp. NPDC051022 TaxID=3155752 RepID=UPI003442366D
MRALGLLGQVDLPAEDAAVPRARHYVRDLLNGVGHPRTDDALLLVSELVTNSVRHSDSGRVPGGRVVVAVSSHFGTLHIDVIDAGSAGRQPYVSSGVSPDSGGGRGLWLVQELSSAWGWYETTAGRVVWFQLTGPCHEEVGRSAPRTNRDEKTDFPTPRTNLGGGGSRSAPKTIRDEKTDLPAPETGRDEKTDLPAPRTSWNEETNLPSPGTSRGSG